MATIKANIKQESIKVSIHQNVIKATVKDAGPQGLQGPAGANGAPGADGAGVPSGGTLGQILKKASSSNFDTVWGNESGGTWGSITGTLASQTDLQTVLTAKQYKTVITVGASNADYITDGVADQTEINAAITAANAAGGGIVQLKGYSATSPAIISAEIVMKSNVILQGEGINTTVIKKVTGGSGNAIRGVSVSNSAVKELKIDGNTVGEATGRGLYWVTSSSILTTRVQCVDATQGFESATCTDLLWSECIADGNYNWNFYTYAGTRVKVINCQSLNAKAGILEGFGMAFYNSSSYCEAIGNYIYNSAHNGLQMNAGNATADVIGMVMRDNVIVNAGYRGIFITDDGNSFHIKRSSFTNNRVSGSVDQGIYAIHVYESSFEGNKSQGNGYDGIILESCTDCSLYGNTTTLNTRHGINVLSSTSVSLVGNITVNNTGTGLLISNDSTLAINVSNITRNNGTNLTARGTRFSLASGTLTIQAGAAAYGSSNTAGGDLILISGVSTGSASSAFRVQVSPFSQTAGTNDNTTQTALVLTAGSGNRRRFSLTGSSGTVDGIELPGQPSNKISVARNTAANTAGTSLTINAGGATSSPSTSNLSGGSLILQSGISQGNGTSQILLQTADVGSTGTTDNALTTRVTVDNTGMAITGALTISTALAIAQGGTGATTASGARTNLGLIIGTDVQPYEAGLTTILPFVKNHGGAFYLKGEKFRFVGGNYYPLIVGNAPQSEVQTIMNSARKKGITVMRTWAFDAGKPPTDSPGNFRFLGYPIGTNLISNGTFETNTTGWTLGSDFTRSSADAHSGTYSIKQVSASAYSGMHTDAITVTASTNYTVTVWYKMVSRSGFGPLLEIKTGDLATQIYDGGLLEDTTGGWVRKQINFNSGANTSIAININNFSGSITAYYDDINICVQGTPALETREATFAQLDMVLDEARKRGIKMILSLADNNTNYDTKATYVGWANSIYSAGLTASYPYTGFFTSSYCRTLYKDFVDLLTSRVNTINGLTYKNDPTIFSWELGNELRYDVFDSESGTQNTINSTNIIAMTSWINDVGGHIHSVDTNHMVNFGDMAHTWQWVSGDTVSNGSGYGVDYNIHSALSVLNFMDVHVYPTQGGDGSQLQKYGQRLGAANAITAAGFRAQLKDFVDVGHANGKPVVISEIGMVKEVTASNTYYPLYPRHTAFYNFFKDFFDLADGGDGMVPWSIGTTGGGTYTINLDDTGGELSTDNSNDTILAEYIRQRNDRFQLDILASQGELDLRYLQKAGDTMTGNFNINNTILLNADGSAVFNEAGDTVSFRVETAGNANAFVISGSDNNISTNVSEINVNYTDVDGDEKSGLFFTNSSNNANADAAMMFTIQTGVSTQDRWTIGVDNTADNFSISYGSTLSENPFLTISTLGALTLGTDLAVTEGGTGASTAAAARTNLGLVIGTDVQAYSANLTTYAGIAPSANVQTLLGAANYAAFKTSLSLNSVENTALSTWAGTSNITTLGTITTGVWNGTRVSEAYGGTNQSTYTLGDILYSSASNTLSKLAGNTTATKKFLRQTGTGTISAAPAWDTLVAGDIPDLSGTYQPLDSDLTTLAGLTATTDNFIVSVSSAWASRTPAQVKTTLSLNNVENTALSTWAGTANITTLGTIVTGVWSGTAIDHTKLTGIVQADVGGLTTASTPTFAGLNLGIGNISTVGNLAIDGSAARDMTVARAASGNGNTITIQAGGGQSGATNASGGNLVLSSGITTGSGTSGIILQVPRATGSGSGDNSVTGTQAIFFSTSANAPLLVFGKNTISTTGFPFTVNALILSGNSAGALSQFRTTTAATAGFNLVVQAGGAVSGGTDLAGGTLQLRPGLSTGTGRANVSIQGLSVATSTGTSDNSTFLDRHIIGAFKALTNNSAISLVSCTLASNTLIGGIIRYAIEVFDGTNLQMETGEVTFQSANKGGVFSGNTITQIGSAKQFLGSGTLTVTWAISGANPSVISVNANSSLTPSTGYPRITYTIENFTQQAIAIQ
jgi:hypothetical protein